MSEHPGQIYQISKLSRLLPGDKAPSLRISHAFNRDGLPAIVFDRLSMVILWNAGCAGCLPTIEALSQLSGEHDVPCYGVAVMVRDIEATAEAARTSPAKALLAVEERPAMPAGGLSRGWVTRHWLEPSGYPGVPAGFIVDRRGLIVWMGDPAEMKPAFFSVLRGEWDVGAARHAWRLKFSDEEIQNRRVVLDLTEMFFEGDIDATYWAIANAEEQWPVLGLDKEFNLLKLDVLTLDPAHHEAAHVHYCRCANLFQGDLNVQTRLATKILQRMQLDNRALQIVIERLIELEDPADETPGRSQRDVINGLAVSLTLADAFARAGLSEEATKRVDKAGLLSDAAGMPEHVRLWTASEIERLRQHLGNDARNIDNNGGMG